MAPRSDHPRSARHSRLEILPARILTCWSRRSHPPCAPTSTIRASRLGLGIRFEYLSTSLYLPPPLARGREAPWSASRRSRCRRPPSRMPDGKDSPLAVVDAINASSDLYRILGCSRYDDPAAMRRRSALCALLHPSSWPASCVDPVAHDEGPDSARFCLSYMLRCKSVHPE